MLFLLELEILLRIRVYNNLNKTRISCILVLNQGNSYNPSLSYLQLL